MLHRVAETAYRYSPIPVAYKDLPYCVRSLKSHKISLVFICLILVKNCRHHSYRGYMIQCINVPKTLTGPLYFRGVSVLVKLSWL